MYKSYRTTILLQKKAFRLVNLKTPMAHTVSLFIYLIRSEIFEKDNNLGGFKSHPHDLKNFRINRPHIRHVHGPVRIFLFSFYFDHLTAISK